LKNLAVPVAAGYGGKSCPLYLGWLLVVLLTLFCARLCRGVYGICKPGFVSVAEPGLVTGDEDVYSTPVDVSQLRVFSFLVFNAGTNPVIVQPQQSPDGVIWDSFGELAYVLEPGQKRLFVPQHFLRFARVRLWNARRGCDSAVTIWFQGQS